jgi:hypothetical protein
LPAGIRRAMAAPRSETSGAIAVTGTRNVVKRDKDASLIDPTSALFISTPSPGSSTGSRPC